MCVCISLSLLFVGFCGYVLYYNGTYSMTFFSMLPEKSNKSCGRSKKNNLLAILNERKIRKRKSPICPTPPKKKSRSVFSVIISQKRMVMTTMMVGLFHKKFMKRQNKKNTSTKINSMRCPCNCRKREASELIFVQFLM